MMLWTYVYRSLCERSHSWQLKIEDLQLSCLFCHIINLRDINVCPCNITVTHLHPILQGWISRNHTKNLEEPWEQSQEFTSMWTSFVKGAVEEKFESSSILSFIHLAALISTGFISKWIRELFSGPTRGMPWVKTSELLLCFVQGQLSLRATFSLSTGSRELAFYCRLFTGTTWRFLSQSSTNLNPEMVPEQYMVSPACLPLPMT